MSETSSGRLGVIAGSGVRAVDLCPEGERRTLGATAVLVSDTTAVIGRHGIEPTPTLPHLVDHRANLAALIDAGCDRVLALCSTGSLRADWAVGTIVAPDDIWSPWASPDWHGDARDHVVPVVSPIWRAAVIDAWRAQAVAPIIDGGTYVQTRGPRFESRAEVRFYGTVGDVVGMTMATELVLANQAGLDYAAVCAVDNLGNGLADSPLAYADFEQGVADNRAQLLADVARVIAALAGPG
jgi:5'-methylthioadenosine phosphorylase